MPDCCTDLFAKKPTRAKSDIVQPGKNTYINTLFLHQFSGQRAAKIPRSGVFTDHRGLQTATLSSNNNFPVN